ncbi:polymorphic toxin-type HINT domain-containing protein [Pseudobythopirellula maris]|nr:polymorphic toxin-type HINT domain-containing protein [Pseudobythopirellula maris]
MAQPTAPTAGVSVATGSAGMVLVGDEPMPVREAQRLAREDERLDRYEATRELTPNTPQGHFDLARWCRRQGLEDEAFYHWLGVLQADASNKTALRALDRVWDEGELVSPDEAARRRAERRHAMKAEKEWKVRIAAWRRAIGEQPDTAESVLEELQAEVDTTAIPVFERLASGQDSAKASERAIEERMCVAFVDALGRMYGVEATASLIRHTLLAPSEELRGEALERLRYKPLEDVLPLLVERFRAPVESHYEVRVDSFGQVHYRHQAMGTATDRNLLKERSRIVTPRSTPISAQGMTFQQRQRAEMQSQRTIAWTVRREAYRAYREAALTENAIAQHNAQAVSNNRQIGWVLAQVTGEEFSDSPRTWWQYSQDYSGYDYPEEAPTESQTQSTQEFILPRQCECFVAGTPVWCKRGNRPIESLAAGDLVLAHDAATDSLVWRPVLETTIRDPSPMVEIAYEGGATVRSTVGHPYWVNGAGWRMAREVAVGDRLRTFDGEAVVAAVHPAEDAEAFNLVVAEAANYFVGEEGLLVHDNTSRSPGEGSERLAAWTD